MDLYVMRYVVSVAEYGNFSQAAAACHVGQPALSQQIARLEREIGVPLFYRNSRGAVPTEAGKEYVRRAKVILALNNDLDAQMSAFAGFRRGTLTLGLITSLECIEFGDMMASFMRNYPEISFSIRQFGSYQLLDMLADHSIDMAFLNKPVERQIPAAINFRKLGEDRYDLAVPYDHRLSGEKEVSIRDLKDERFIFHQPWQIASELVTRACAEAGFAPDIACRSGEPSISINMVQGGMGVAVLPSEEFAKRKLNGVVHVRLRENIIKEVGMAWRKDSESPLIRTLVEFAGEWAREI